MSPAADFLRLLRLAGFQVFAGAGKLFVQPRDRLGEADVATVQKLKPELLELLAAERWVKCTTCEAGVDSAEDLTNCCNRGTDRWGRDGCPYKQVRTITPEQRGTP